MLSFLYSPNSHIHTWQLEKTIAWTRWTFVRKVMSLLFNMLSRLVITFLPRSKRLLITWLQSPSAVILEPPKIKSDTVALSVCHQVMGPDAMVLAFWMLSFKPTFSLSFFTFIKRLFSSSFSAIRVLASIYMFLFSLKTFVHLSDSSLIILFIIMKWETKKSTLIWGLCPRGQS